MKYLWSINDTLITRYRQVQVRVIIYYDLYGEYYKYHVVLLVFCSTFFFRQKENVVRLFINIALQWRIIIVIIAHDRRCMQLVLQWNAKNITVNHLKRMIFKFNLKYHFQNDQWLTFFALKKINSIFANTNRKTVLFVGGRGTNFNIWVIMFWPRNVTRTSECNSQSVELICGRKV